MGGLAASVARAKDAIESGSEHDPSRLDRLLGCDAAEVCRRLLAPARPRKQDALAAIDGAAHAQEALEALIARGLCDESWLDGRRVFVRALEVADVQAGPRELAELAADAATVAAVEALALECRARGGRSGTDVIRWRVGLAQRAARARDRRPFDEGRSSRFKPGTVVASSELVQPLFLRTDFEAVESADDDWVAFDQFRLAHERWIDAFEEDVRRYWSWALARRNAALNVYEPLCAAWLSGYVIEAIEPEIVLFSPARFELE